MNRRLALSLVLSVALHVALLRLAGFAADVPAPGRSGEGRQVVAHLRSIDPPGLAGLADRPPAAVAVRAEDAPPPSGEEVGDIPPVAVDQAAPVADAGSPPGDARPPVVLPILPDAMPRGFDRDAYFPGAMLDRRPMPENPIVIDSVDPTRIDKKRGEIVIELYVGADGRVDLAEIGDSDLPPEVGAFVADTFRKARMHPGVRDGQPVKARMKVVVEFEVR